PPDEMPRPALHLRPLRPSLLHVVLPYVDEPGAQRRAHRLGWKRLRHRHDPNGATIPAGTPGGLGDHGVDHGAPLPKRIDLGHAARPPSSDPAMSIFAR